jgi:hypothetical protein
MGTRPSLRYSRSRRNFVEGAADSFDGRSASMYLSSISSCKNFITHCSRVFVWTWSATRFQSSSNSSRPSSNNRTSSSVHFSSVSDTAEYSGFEILVKSAEDVPEGKLPSTKHLGQRSRFKPPTLLVCPGCSEGFVSWKCTRVHSTPQLKQLITLRGSFTAASRSLTSAELPFATVSPFAAFGSAEASLPLAS